MGMLEALTPDQIRDAAPAAFTTTPGPETSARYGFISTLDLLNELWARDFSVVDAQQDTVRSPARSSLHARHALSLVSSELLGRNDIDDNAIPRIQIINEHRGHGRAHIGTGIYRLVCMNGMTVGTPDAAVMVRHSANAARAVDEILPTILAAQERSIHAIEHWREINVTPAQAQTFAQRAAQLRFGEESAAAYEPAEILRLRRPEDEGDSLWRVFNRVQENLTRHSLRGTSANGRVIRSRPITGITLNARFNSGIWNLAEELAQAA